MTTTRLVGAATLRTVSAGAAGASREPSSREGCFLVSLRSMESLPPEGSHRSPRRTPSGARAMAAGHAILASFVAVGLVVGANSFGLLDRAAGGDASSFDFGTADSTPDTVPVDVTTSAIGPATSETATQESTDVTTTTIADAGRDPHRPGSCSGLHRRRLRRRQPRPAARRHPRRHRRGDLEARLQGVERPVAARLLRLARPAPGRRRHLPTPTSSW